MRVSRVGMLIPFFLVVAFGLIFCPTSAVGQDDLGCEEMITVAPNVLNIQSLGTVVTVHTELPYALVDEATVSLDGIPIDWSKADNQGYFVAKFPMDAVKALAGSSSMDLPGYMTLTLEGVVDDEYFCGVQDILVIDILPKGR